MGKRKGEWLSFMALLLMFMLTTLFFYMVYTMHYDSAADDFTGFTVFDYQSEPGAQVRTKLGTLRRNCRLGLCGMVPKNMAYAL